MIMLRKLVCRHCDFEFIHDCRFERISIDRRTWLRVVVTNWWENGWRVESRPGEIIPIGYGLSWHKVNELTLVLNPIPCNVLMRGFREVCCWLMRGGPWQMGTVQDRIDAGVARRLGRG